MVDALMMAVMTTVGPGLGIVKGDMMQIYDEGCMKSV